MNTDPKYCEALEVCGPCLGELTTDDIYCELSPEELEEVQLHGFVGLSYREWHNAWTPGMSRKEANARSGYFTHIYQWGASVPTVVGPGWEGKIEPCSGERDYGFYWVVKGEKDLEEYLAAAGR